MALPSLSSLQLPSQSEGGARADGLPNLSNLPRFPRKNMNQATEDNDVLADGVYCLDRYDDTSACAASILYKRKALIAAPGEFVQAAEFMQSDRVPQQKFMGHDVPRKQATFGLVKYKSYPLISDHDQWPSLVKRVLSVTQEFAEQLGDPNPEMYNAVHANYYPRGDSSVNRHADDEPLLVEDAPIFSYTYIQDDDDDAARPFTVWRKSSGVDHVQLNPQEGVKKTPKLFDIMLYSGDLLVMQGNMQKHFDHSIEKRKHDSVKPRLNFTVRKHKTEEEMKHMKAMQAMRKRQRETAARQSNLIIEILDKNIEDGLVPPEEREARMAKIMEASKQLGA